MGWPAPTDSKSAVKRAGDRFRHGNWGIDDLATLNRWRAAHGYLINTFQANMRARTKGNVIPVAQRLKRAATIIDKLKQGRSDNLATMQDIAGVRLVFADIVQMNEFRAKVHSSRAKHELTHDPERYHYVIHPKSSGYRGIHDVYRYRAATASGSLWNGLKIEIQYRTVVQHAWATAVELSDQITQNRVKFGQGVDSSERFFQICSELLARKHEGMAGCLADEQTADLIEEWHAIELRLHLFSQLKRAARQDANERLEGFVILMIDDDGELHTEKQSSYGRAVLRLTQLEADHPEWVVVLVSGQNDSLRTAYRNYFSNSTEFVMLMEEALKHA